jgi:hypothetical protein
MIVFEYMTIVCDCGGVMSCRRCLGTGKYDITVEATTSLKARALEARGLIELPATGTVLKRARIIPHAG